MSARVLIGEPQPAYRSALHRILEDGGFDVCAECSTADEVLDSARRENPDLCLLELRLPGGGTRAIGELSRLSAPPAVVVLTTSREREDLLDAIRAGAVGYLLKDMDPGRLAHALTGVLAGEAAIPRIMVAKLVSELKSQGRRRVLAGRAGRADLSAREWQVLNLMCDGLDDRAIAEDLAVSPVTVRRHISGLVRKLGVASRAEAVALFEQHRLE